jgi:hypothetical protein
METVCPLVQSPVSHITGAHIPEKFPRAESGFFPPSFPLSSTSPQEDYMLIKCMIIYEITYINIILDLVVHLIAEETEAQGGQ